MRPLAARLDPPSASSAPQKAKSRPGDGQRQQAEVSAGFQDTLRRVCAQWQQDTAVHRAIAVW